MKIIYFRGNLTTCVCIAFSASFHVFPSFHSFIRVCHGSWFHFLWKHNHLHIQSSWYHLRDLFWCHLEWQSRVCDQRKGCHSWLEWIDGNSHLCRHGSSVWFYTHSSWRLVWHPCQWRQHGYSAVPKKSFPSDQENRSRCMEWNCRDSDSDNHGCRIRCWSSLQFNRICFFSCRLLLVFHDHRSRSFLVCSFCFRRHHESSKVVFVTSRVPRTNKWLFRVFKQ